MEDKEEQLFCNIQGKESSIRLCRDCNKIFRKDLTTPNTCPKCGSSNTAEMPLWEPEGFNLHESKLVWEYECQLCKHVFELPIPSSPSQEKEITCPECGGCHVHRMTSVGGQPLYCG